MMIAIISSTKDIASTNIKKALLHDFEFEKMKEMFEGKEVFQYKGTKEKKILDKLEKENLDNEKHNTENNKLMENDDEKSIKKETNEKRPIIDNNEKIIKLYTIDTDPIYSEELDKKIDADIFVFISKHSAAEGKQSLTVHPIGNFGSAEKGGRENKICPTEPAFLKNILLEMEKNSRGFEAEVTMEATHHGPYLEKPVIFVEIGSKEEHWKNEEAAKIISKSVINGLLDESEYENLIILGGSHYNYIANKVIFKSEFAVGHICAKHNLLEIDIEKIKDALVKSKADIILLDWKGLGGEKIKIRDILDQNEIVFERSDKFFK